MWRLCPILVCSRVWFSYDTVYRSLWCWMEHMHSALPIISHSIWWRLHEAVLGYSDCLSRCLKFLHLSSNMHLHQECGTLLHACMDSCPVASSAISSLHFYTSCIRECEDRFEQCLITNGAGTDSAIACQRDRRLCKSECHSLHYISLLWINNSSLGLSYVCETTDLQLDVMRASPNIDYCCTQCNNSLLRCTGLYLLLLSFSSAVIIYVYRWSGKSLPWVHT